MRPDQNAAAADPDSLLFFRSQYGKSIPAQGHLFSPLAEAEVVTEVEAAMAAVAAPATSRQAGQNLDAAEIAPRAGSVEVASVEIVLAVVPGAAPMPGVAMTMVTMETANYHPEPGPDYCSSVSMIRALYQAWC